MRGIWFGEISGGRRLPIKGILLVCLFLLYAYGTSRGVLHYDTSLYHAQSIRWLEEYGAVKGLGNLHCRLAYNSASFALSALYSMVFLGGQSYHAAAGFFALILAGVCAELADVVRRKRLRTSDFARVMGIYYLLIIFDEMISPASDYFMVLTAFYIIIRWLDLLEKKEEAVCPYAMLCVLGVFLLTVKLSAAWIILLTIAPAYRLVSGKKWKETAVYLLLGVTVVLPFLIRNVLLSGWLVYPFTGIDLFQTDWKIPEGIAAYDAKEIQVWGRGYSDVTKYDIPVMEWLPDWFRGLGGMDKLFVLAALVSVGVFLLRLVWVCRYVVKNKNRSPGGVLPWESLLEKILLEFTVSVCFLFWLFSSPLIRYGCVYVYLTSAVVWGDVFTAFWQNGLRKGFWRNSGKEKIGEETGWKAKLSGFSEQVCMLLIGLFLLYKAAAFGGEIAASYVDDYWLCQKDYDNYETERYEIEGIPFYCPVTGDQTGYRDFPSSPVKAQIGLRGAGLQDGFYFRGQ